MLEPVLFKDIGIPLRWIVADAPAPIVPVLVSAQTRPPASRSSQLSMLVEAVRSKSSDSPGRRLKSLDPEQA